MRPGRVAWSWWADSSSPASFERQKDYVDFAARVGWEYVLVDAGWDPAWVPALTAYARRRHVGVLLWSRWDALRPAAQRDALLSRWRSWGVAGVKLDFMHSDSHQRMGWYRGVARAAAKRRLLVNFHGSTVPRGMSRTWPNVLTMEGVLGAETLQGRSAGHAGAQRDAAVHAQRDRPDGLHAGHVLRPAAPDQHGARAGAVGRLRVGAAALRRQPRGLRGRAAGPGAGCAACRSPGTRRGC